MASDNSTPPKQADPMPDIGQAANDQKNLAKVAPSADAPLGERCSAQDFKQGAMRHEMRHCGGIVSGRILPAVFAPILLANPDKLARSSTIWNTS